MRTWRICPNRLWQVWIDGQKVATVELDEWTEISPFRTHLVEVAGTRDIELVSDAHATGTLVIL